MEGIMERQDTQNDQSRPGREVAGTNASATSPGADQTAALVAYLENEDTAETMVASILDNLAFYQNIDVGERVDQFAGAIYNWFIRECVGHNQYLVISQDAYGRVFDLYRRLVLRLKTLPRCPASPANTANTTDPAAQAERDGLRDAVRATVHEHRRELISILSSVGGPPPRDSVLLPCAEYSAEFQLAILRLDPERALGPVLDIGCGERATLVSTLRERGVEAIGIDQYQPGANDGGVLRANWLEFPYLADYWGTIISHLAFTNHFVRALKTDAELAALYHAVYREVLDSLRVGGSFHYAPALPQAESRLDRRRFAIERFPNEPGNPALDTVIIRRIT
jgi:hypothetical protein